VTRRIATTAATMAALLLLPASALAVESVSVTGGVLTYTAGDGTVDDVWLTESNGLHYLSEPTSPSGGIGAGCVYVGSATAECTGATSAVIQLLDGDDSVTVLASLPATLSGGGGVDTLIGGPLADDIDGGAGADTINGGGGDDAIEARDGEVDTIDCGPGDDPVEADANDVLTNCEPVPDPEPPAPPAPEAPVEPAGEPAPPPVEAPPVATPPLETPPAQLPGDAGTLPPLAVLPVTIEQEVIKVDASGVATFDLACAATEVAGCEGVVYLDPAPRAKKRKRRAVAARRGRYGRSRFDVAAGSKVRLRLSLSPAARRKLGLKPGKRARMARRGRRVKAQVTVQQRGKRPVRSGVTLRRP
jgi:hypothetical protein